MRLRQACLLAASPLALAAVASSQAAFPFTGNQVQLTEGGTFVYIYSSPSIGGPTGAPLLTGDLAYKGVPGNRLRSSDGTVDITLLQSIFLGDVDWPGGAPDFYDIAFGTSSAVNGMSLDYLVPDFFTTGSLGALLSLGNSGFPHPCVVSPTMTCSGSTSCPPLITGYEVDVSLAAPISLPTNNDDVSGIYMGQFLPGGMIFNTSSMAGTCGNGDYVFQGANSQTETQADLLNQPGAAWAEGFQVSGPGGPGVGAMPTALFSMLEITFGVTEPVIEPLIADPIVGYGPVRGGASLAVDTSTGSATIAAFVSADPSLVGSFVFPAASTVQLATPAPVFGANLLLLPNGVFNTTLSAWATTGTLAPPPGVVLGPTHVEAISPALALPVINTSLHLQAFIVTNFGPIMAVETTSWTIDLR